MYHLVFDYNREYSVLIRLLRELSSLYLDDGGYTEDIQSVF